MPLRRARCRARNAHLLCLAAGTSTLLHARATPHTPRHLFLNPVVVALPDEMLASSHELLPRGCNGLVSFVRLPSRPLQAPAKHVEQHEQTFEQTWFKRMDKVGAIGLCPFEETLCARTGSNIGCHRARLTPTPLHYTIHHADLDNDVRLWNASHALSWWDRLPRSVWVSGLLAPNAEPAGHSTHGRVPRTFPEVNGGTLLALLVQKCRAYDPWASKAHHAALD